MFTADGTYTDEAVRVTFRGRKEIAGWKARADTLIDNVHVTIRATHRDGDRITVRAVYSGHLKGAPTHARHQHTNAALTAGERRTPTSTGRPRKETSWPASCRFTDRTRASTTKCLTDRYKIRFVDANCDGGLLTPSNKAGYPRLARTVTPFRHQCRAARAPGP